MVCLQRKMWNEALAKLSKMVKLCVCSGLQNMRQSTELCDGSRNDLSLNLDHGSNIAQIY